MEFWKRPSSQRHDKAHQVLTHAIRRSKTYQECLFEPKQLLLSTLLLRLHTRVSMQTVWILYSVPGSVYSGDSYKHISLPLKLSTRSMKPTVLAHFVGLENTVPIARLLSSRRSAHPCSDKPSWLQSLQLWRLYT